MQDQELRKRMKPGSKIDPASVVKQVWGLDVVSYKELDSYDDRNYHCVVRNTDGSDTMYTLKFQNGVDSNNKVHANKHCKPASPCLMYVLTPTRIEPSRLPEQNNAASITAWHQLPSAL